MIIHIIARITSRTLSREQSHAYISVRTFSPVLRFHRVVALAGHVASHVCSSNRGSVDGWCAANHAGQQTLGSAQKISMGGNQGKVGTRMGHEQANPAGEAVSYTH